MSRIGDDNYDPNFRNEGAFWEHRTEMALRGRKGRKALEALRDALLALPEKRLITDALSTVGKAPGEKIPYEDLPQERRFTYWQDETARHLVQEQGEGMCSVAAYAWHQRVKAGEDPDDVMRDLPLAPPDDAGSYMTLDTGTKAGLNQHVAWEFMRVNDDRYADLTPEARYTAVLGWIEERLAMPPLTAPKRKAKVDA